MLWVRAQSASGTDNFNGVCHMLQAADWTLQQLKQLRWPSGDGISLAAEIILLVHDAVDRVVLDVKVQVRPLRTTSLALCHDWRCAGTAYLEH